MRPFASPLLEGIDLKPEELLMVRTETDPET